MGLPERLDVCTDNSFNTSTPFRAQFWKLSWEGQKVLIGGSKKAGNESSIKRKEWQWLRSEKKEWARRHEQDYKKENSGMWDKK